MSSWNDSLLTGVKLIDDQHRDLVARMDHMMDACRQGKGYEEIGDTLKFAVSYVQRHFKDEEGLQAKYEYPGRDEHKTLHAGFVTDVIDLLQEYKKTGPSTELTAKINKTLITWLVTHIHTEDQKVGRHILKSTGKGVR